MILMIVSAPRQTTVALATAAGELTERRDASWRVGSGQSLASHVSALLAEADCPIDDLTRVALVDQGSSYTSERTAYAFVEALRFASELPIVLIRELDHVLLGELARRAAMSEPVTGPMVPRYSN